MYSLYLFCVYVMCSNFTYSRGGQLFDLSDFFTKLTVVPIDIVLQYKPQLSICIPSILMFKLKHKFNSFFLLRKRHTLVTQVDYSTMRSYQEIMAIICVIIIRFQSTVVYGERCLGQAVCEDAQADYLVRVHQLSVLDYDITHTTLATSAFHP